MYISSDESRIPLSNREGENRQNFWENQFPNGGVRLAVPDDSMIRGGDSPEANTAQVADRVLSQAREQAWAQVRARFAARQEVQNEPRLASLRLVERPPYEMSREEALDVEREIFRSVYPRPVEERPRDPETGLLKADLRDARDLFQDSAVRVVAVRKPCPKRLEQEEPQFLYTVQRTDFSYHSAPEDLRIRHLGSGLDEYFYPVFEGAGIVTQVSPESLLVFRRRNGLTSEADPLPTPEELEQDRTEWRGYWFRHCRSLTLPPLARKTDDDEQIQELARKDSQKEAEAYRACPVRIAEKPPYEMSREEALEVEREIFRSAYSRPVEERSRDSETGLLKADLREADSLLYRDSAVRVIAVQKPCPKQLEHEEPQFLYVVQHEYEGAFSVPVNLRLENVRIRYPFFERHFIFVKRPVLEGAGMTQKASSEDLLVFRRKNGLTSEADPLPTSEEIGGNRKLLERMRWNSSRLPSNLPLLARKTDDDEQIQELAKKDFKNEQWKRAEEGRERAMREQRERERAERRDSSSPPDSSSFVEDLCGGGVILLGLVLITGIVDSVRERFFKAPNLKSAPVSTSSSLSKMSGDATGIFCEPLHPSSGLQNGGGRMLDPSAVAVQVPRGSIGKISPVSSNLELLKTVAVVAALVVCLGIVFWGASKEEKRKRGVK